jgi:NAD(P)-dependent dehydrogenase (short-subunit alcohol dehydrogenase family)
MGARGAVCRFDARQRVHARCRISILHRWNGIVRAVVFPAAEEAGFVTGSTLSINGGQQMS